MALALAIDTNIFLYGHCKQFEYYSACHQFLKNLTTSSQQFYLSYQVYYEYLRVATHPSILNTPLSAARAHQDMAIYFTLPQAQVLVEQLNHFEVVNEIFKKIPSAKANFIHDCHYAALLYEHGIKNIVTTDMDFKKFDFLKVMNPLTDSMEF